jgi:hypothetical protein
VLLGKSTTHLNHYSGEDKAALVGGLVVWHPSGNGKSIAASSASADVGNARLRFYIAYIVRRLCLRRQLQHGRVLARA